MTARDLTAPAYAVTVSTREEAHRAGCEVYASAWQIAANGGQARVIVIENDEDISTKQRAFLHAAVFPQIAEQAVVNGTRFVASIWKEFYRARFLPDRWESRYALIVDKATGKVRRAKKKTPHRVRQSTEDLGLARYSQYIDMVIDHAVLELGVVFEFRAGEREGVRYVKPPRKAKAAPATQQGEVVDVEAREVATP